MVYPKTVAMEAPLSHFSGIFQFIDRAAFAWNMAYRRQSFGHGHLY